MKIIVFNGSPFGTDSRTNIIAEAFLKGARKAGAETENVFLVDKKIGYCKGCFHCWFKTPGKCVMEDDMTDLLVKYHLADVVCFASPVYTWNMTAILKNFVDRLVPLKSPLIVNRRGSFDLENSSSKEQQFMVISNCGFPGDNNFETMKKVFSCCNPVLEIYRNCGQLLKSKDESIKTVVNEYLKNVEQAGFEMTTQGKVTEGTKISLDMQLMSIPDYVKYIGM